MLFRSSLADLQKSPFRCQLLQAIAHNIGDIGTNVAKRWKDEFRSTVANASQRGAFESDRDATLDFLKAVVEDVRRIAKDKLFNVTGETQAAAKERKAESWRSDRSVRNIRLNVDALQALFNQSKPLSIGVDGTGGSTYAFDGYIDEARVTKGIARYASDTTYTVPTAAFPRS